MLFFHSEKSSAARKRSPSKSKATKEKKDGADSDDSSDDSDQVIKQFFPLQNLKYFFVVAKFLTPSSLWQTFGRQSVHGRFVGLPRHIGQCYT